MNNGNLDVFMRESLNKGVSWSTKLKINDDLGNALQDLVWAAFDTDGDLVISWRDRRNGSSNGYKTDSEIWAAVRKHDSTSFSSNFRVSDALVPYNTILAESGNDFMSIKYINDTLHAVWGDPRDGVLNIWYQKMTDKGNVVSVTNITKNKPINVSIYPNPT